MKEKQHNYSGKEENYDNRLISNTGTDRGKEKRVRKTGFYKWLYQQ
jgi:hypothetical protein